MTNLTEYTIRPVTEADHALLLSLAERCPPLDVHTPYTYWVQCTLFSKSCFVLTLRSEDVGFITAVENEREALIWQIGILPAHRGKGCSSLLIGAALDVLLPRREVFVTIAPENRISLQSFQSACRKRGLCLTAVKPAEESLCPDRETTYRIG